MCFPQILLAIGEKSCWLCCRELWCSVMCQWNPAVGGALLSASSKSCLPLVCRRSEGNDLNVWTGDLMPLFKHLPSSPWPLSPKPWKQADMANVIWELALQTFARCCHCRGFLQAQAELFWCKMLLLPILDQLLSYKNSKRNKNDWLHCRVKITSRPNPGHCFSNTFWQVERW